MNLFLVASFLCWLPLSINEKRQKTVCCKWVLIVVNVLDANRSRSNVELM